jgi:hypothetical protein
METFLKPNLYEDFCNSEGISQSMYSGSDVKFVRGPLKVSLRNKKMSSLQSIKNYF